MKIQFLGTGGAFDPEYGNAAALVRSNGKAYLVDCGFTVYAKLKEHNLFNEIDYILLTHLHNDHTGSLANVLLHYNLISNPGEKMKIIYPAKKYRRQISDFLSVALIDTDKYVDWVSIKDTGNVQAIDTYGLHVKNYQTYGYYFREGNDVIAYSGDIGDGNFIFQKLKKNKITGAIVFHDITFDKDPCHTHYPVLMEHLEDHQIHGYHCNPEKNKIDNVIPLVADQPRFLVKKNL
ncbi:MAG: ribonuclease Z [Chitinophagales bacterium]|nr:ribonuclease Z [Chitinophagales bacterium]